MIGIAGGTRLGAGGGAGGATIRGLLWLRSFMPPACAIRACPGRRHFMPRRHDVTPSGLPGPSGKLGIADSR